MVWKPDYSKVPKVQRILGYPIKIYDDGGGKFLDRYTVVYYHRINKTGRTGGYDYIGMSENPFHGVGHHGEDVHPGPHLGKRILWADLPEECQKAVTQDIEEYKKWIEEHGEKL